MCLNCGQSLLLCFIRLNCMISDNIFCLAFVMPFDHWCLSFFMISLTLSFYALIWQLIHFFWIQQFSIGTNLSFVVKAYAITALTKIYAFEIAAGRKVDMLSEVFAEKFRLKFSTCSIVTGFLQWKWMFKFWAQFNMTNNCPSLSPQKNCTPMILLNERK